MTDAVCDALVLFGATGDLDDWHIVPQAMGARGHLQLSDQDRLASDSSVATHAAARLTMENDPGTSVPGLQDKAAPSGATLELL